MNKNRLFTVITALCICAAGCSNDTNTSEDSCNGKCESDQVCQKGKCVDKSEAATEDTVCKKTKTTCFDSTTLKVCKKGEEPVQKACKEGKCVDGECVTECESTKNTCLDDDTLSVCKEGEEPTEQKCSDIVENGKCIDGECIASGEPAPIEEIACENSSTCPEGTYCDNNEQNEKVCIPYRKAGESCELYTCSQELTCDENICKKPVSIGEACDEFSLCESYLCIDGTCAIYSKLYEECSKSLVCPEESVCVDKQCVPIKGGCKTNLECTGDSYCCLDESCGRNAGVCIPYSQEKPYDPECKIGMQAGIFEASVQCRWVPKYKPTANTVLNTPAIGKLHNKLGIEKPLLVYLSSQYLVNPMVLRILNTETCEEVENIDIPQEASNNLALADFDGDGYMEIVIPGATVYHWDESAQKHVVLSKMDFSRSPAVSIHDLDNDGTPEIIDTAGNVAHADGTMILKADLNSDYSTPTLGDINGDGIVEFLQRKGIYQWDSSQKSWKLQISIPETEGFSNETAFADFGTPGQTAADFDFEHLDGKAEIVRTSGSILQIVAAYQTDGSPLPNAQIIFSHTFIKENSHGYPPAIGDFDGDKLPEIGVASNEVFGVYDPRCQNSEAGKCQGKGVIWESPTHDGSGMAGASAFDFDGDGRIEIVYGDECFSRIYNGQTGEVLFSSARNSGTSLEYPIIADVDDDGSTEIVISSDEWNSCDITLDPSHRGVKCEVNEDCYSGSCIGGLCRCTSDEQCNWQTINGKLYKQYSCLSPLQGDENGGKVCRAIVHEITPGITILRDRLDRWVSSRTLWNQHAYTITNINDDGSIPKTSDWKQNYTTAGLNNFRQQRQGSTGSGVAPDITGRFTSAADACIVENGQVKMTAQVCNRGTKAVGSRMPAIFYKDSIANENILCVSYTDEMVPVQGCRDVSCSISKEVADSLSDKKIILKVNDDGKGGKTTVECNEGNNTDEIVMKACRIVN